MTISARPSIKIWICIASAVGAIIAIRYIHEAPVLGLITLGYLCLALAIGSRHVGWRRPLLIGVVCFALPHAYFGFFDVLGGLSGLPFLLPRQIIAIILSSIVLIVLLLGIWKLPWRWIQVAGGIIILHVALMEWGELPEIRESFGPHTFHFILAIALAIFMIVVLILQKLGYIKKN